MCATANVADNSFQWLMQQVDGRMIVLSDTGFHAAEGDPNNLKLCQRGEWQDRMLVETVLSMLTLVAGSGKRDYSRSLPSDRRRVREAGLLPLPALRTGRESFPSSGSSISKAV